MLINLSIASLYASSYSNSPMFSTNARYSIKSCQFIKMFPIIFYQTPKLNVFNSNFDKLQSELIIVDSQDKVNQIFTDDMMPFTETENANYIRCVFSNIGNSGSTIKVDATFTECLFYRINVGSSQFFFIINSPKLSINGCCFSSINTNSESQGILFYCRGGNQITLDSNIITSSKVLKYIDSEVNLQCKNCNFTSNTFSNLFEFTTSSSQVVELKIDDTQFTHNVVTSIIHFNSQSGKISLSSCFLTDDKINSNPLGYGPFGASCAILYTYCSSISITNSVFNRIEKDESMLPLTLFSSPGGAAVTLTNNKFGQSIYNYISYPNPQSTNYANNNQIFGEIATTVMSMNEYLYQNYRKECDIYLYPTTQFTASNAFTPSNSFTPITPTVNAAYGVVGAIGTAVVSFGISSLIWLSIRKFCIYDHDNYLHMDV